MQPLTGTVRSQVGPPPAISVVVPTYNERERLDRFASMLFDALDAHRLGGELIIVDDNSPDGTGAIADALALRYPVRVVHRCAKLGLGSAVVAGFAVARGELLAVMDADVSHPPEMLPVLAAALRQTGVDFVVGSRYVRGGGTRNWPAYRAFMSRMACAGARLLTPVHDAASGFFVIRKEVLRDVVVQAAGFKICLELLVRGSYSTVAEVPYVFVDRAAGASKMNHREAMGYLVQLRHLLAWQRRHRPGQRPSYRQVSAEETRRFAQPRPPLSWAAVAEGEGARGGDDGT
ncbi:MAG: polyprenol monophosphomannose synthase [Acidobacteriota bacterium]